MATKITSVNIPIDLDAGFTTFPLIFDNEIESDLLDLGNLRLIGIFWDSVNDVWGKKCGFKTALTESGEVLPVNIEVGGAYVPYETAPLEGGYNKIDETVLAGARYLRVMADGFPGSATTGQIYLVLKA